jgi:hypothetical protein
MVWFSSDAEIKTCYIDSRVTAARASCVSRGGNHRTARVWNGDR